MMRIVHIVESFAAGTLCMVQGLVNQQAADGHELVLCYSLRAETPPDWRAGLHPAVRCEWVPMCRAPRPLADARAMWRLARLLRQLRPDVVHLHSSKAGALGRLLSPWWRGTRWFYSPHGWSFLQSTTPGRVHPLYRLIEWMLARLPVQLVACSPTEAELAQRYLGRPAHVVCNGIAPADPSPREHGGSRLCIGTSGRVCTPRNPALFARLAQRFQGRDIDWYWLGGGDADDEQKLRDAGVQVSGWLPRSRVIPALARLDIYIQASLWEGMPVALLEAMQQGLPVVVSDVAGNRDVVVHEQCGLIAPVADEAQFALQLERLLADEGLRRTLGQAARQRVLEQFSLQRMAQDMYRVYAA